MSRRKNTFSKAIKHLKESPTNSTSGVYSAVPGTTTRTETEVGPTQPDYSTIDWEIDGGNGDDTSGLFDGAGNHKLISPPGDNSYILGPMVSMYYTYASPHWTRIGYLRESDRRMVNLGTITGTIEDWDGETGFQSYGQLTLEQAAWFKHTPKKPDGYRAFYPGPPSSSPDAFGRYYCTITGTPLATHNPTVTTTNAPFDLQSASNFAAILDRLVQSGKDTGKNIWDILSGLGSNSFIKGALNILRTLTDPVQFAGDWMFKGLPKGIDYLPSFTGAGPSYLGGKKWGDILPFGRQLAGSNYAGQYFTPSFDKAIQYATNVKTGEVGTVVAMPRTAGVRGWKNWFGGNVSRGFGFGDIEKFVRTSDTVANANLTRIFDISDPATRTALEALQASGSRSTAVLSRVGRIVPILNAGLVVADVTSRLQNGDLFGAVLGATQIIPGPIGWTALAAQVAYDVDGHFNKNGFKGVMTGQATEIDLIGDYLKAKGTKGSRKRFGEEYIMEQQEIDIGGMGQALIDMGLPKDKNEFIRQMALQFTLQGVNPQFLSIFLLSLAGKPLSRDQEKWVKDNVGKMAQAFAAKRPDVEDLEPDNPLATEDDPWALQRQQTQEGVELSEERKLSILNSLKEPVVIPETKQKSYKVRPGRRGKTNFQGMDKLVGDIKPQKSFKEPQDIWSDGWQGHNARLSQDKKNIVLEKIGEGKQAWEYMLKYGTKMDAKNLEEFWGKNPDFYSYCFDGKKYKPTRKEQVGGDYLVFLVDEVGKTSSMLQSELNEKLSEESDKEMLAEYNKTNEPIPFLDDPLVRRVAKRLKSQIDYPDKPAVKGYPDEAPPKMVNGFHPELGKKYKYDKLDPVSAIAMRNAPTGDQEIDHNVKKSSVKPKVAEDSTSDWRDSISYD